MEELVGFLPWNLEADKALARYNGLVTLTAVDSCSPLHKSPPLCLASLVGKRKFCPRREIQLTTVNFLLVHAGNVEPAAKKWQWTGSSFPLEWRFPGNFH
jgi:hypothetical protein